MPLRILLISHHSRIVRGGAPLADLALADALGSLGHQVQTIFFEEVLPEYVKATWRQLIFPWAVSLAQLRCGPRRYDVIETTAGDAWLLAPLMGIPRSQNRPVLSVRTHGLEHRRVEFDRRRRKELGTHPGPLTRLYHYRFRLWEVARDLRSADVAYFLNEEDADFARSRLGIPPERIRIGFNGIASSLLEHEVPPPFSTRVFRLIFVGAWSPLKGSDAVPRIVGDAFALDPRFRLTCAGVQCAADEVLACFPRDLRDRISVVERYEQNELPGLLEPHGVLLFPSPAEGASLALLEAMAAGLIPLTTPSGWARDHLRSGVNGYLIEPADHGSYLETLREIMLNPELAASLSARARATVAGMSWKSVARERLATWAHLLEDRPAGPRDLGLT